jgi:hypothetical protein
MPLERGPLVSQFSIGTTNLSSRPVRKSSHSAYSGKDLPSASTTTSSIFTLRSAASSITSFSTDMTIPQPESEDPPLPNLQPTNWRRKREFDLETKKKYFCTACNQVFLRKYNWKVHEARYHEQFRYNCPDCNQVLYAETHFRSHHRDAHGCQQCTHAKDVVEQKEIGKRVTAWGCGFCAELLTDWEQRCDHVSRHYDDGVRRSEWNHPKVIFALLKQPELNGAWKTFLISRHGQIPNPPLSFKWSRGSTGRSVGNSQNLQDLWSSATPNVTLMR